MDKRHVIRVAIEVGAVLLAILVVWAVWPAAAVEGDNPAERVASVIRMVDEKPVGALRALAGTAASAQEDSAVRQAALVGLAQFPRNNCRPIVEEALRDPLPNIRAAGASAMGAYADNAACDRLGDLILEKPDGEPSVRVGAVKGLGLSPNPKALAWLIRAAERETSPVVHRQILVEAYAKLGMRYYGNESMSLTEAQRRAPAEYLKRDPKVQESFRMAAWPLERHLEFDVPSHPKERHHAENN